MTTRIPRPLVLAAATALSAAALGGLAAPAQADDAAVSTWELSATTAATGETIIATAHLAKLPDGTVCTADVAFPGSTPKGVVFTPVGNDSFEITAFAPGTYDINWPVGGCYKSGPYALPAVSVTFTGADLGTQVKVEPNPAKVGELVKLSIRWAPVPAGAACAEIYMPLQSKPEGVRWYNEDSAQTIDSFYGWDAEAAITADAPGTYLVSFGADGCHQFTDVAVTFEDAPPILTPVERLLAFLVSFVKQLIALLRGAL